MKEDIARALLNIGAVKVNVSEPFRYTSGILSPIYTDNRMIISYVEERKMVTEGFAHIVEENNLKVDVCSGTATAGIPYAAFLAARLDTSMVYVRKKPKGHGTMKYVEGDLREGQHVLIVEDLVSTGSSSVRSAENVRNEGGVVTDCVAIFSYGLEKAKMAFMEAGITLHTLTDFETLMVVAAEEGYISDEEREKALEWNADSEGWGAKMGLE